MWRVVLVGAVLLLGLRLALLARSDPTPPPSAPDADRGAVRYAILCANCHGEGREGFDGAGDRKGPPLPPEALPADDAALARLIDLGRLPHMPAFGGLISPAARDDVIAWLRTPLRAVEGGR